METSTIKFPSEAEIQASTPLLRSYWGIKQHYPSGLVFFQVGDFYELFYDDARTVASFLGITLTSRGKDAHGPIPLCGVPVHTIDSYVGRLVKGGFTVVICSQLEEARPGKLVKRGITQVLSPATITNEQLLAHKTASYVVCIKIIEKTAFLIIFELLSGELLATKVHATAVAIEYELAKYAPDELVFDENDSIRVLTTHFKERGFHITTISTSEKTLITTPITPDNKEFKEVFDVCAAYLAYHALDPALINGNCNYYEPDAFLQIDPRSCQMLDLVINSFDGSSSHTLFEHLDAAKTAMGSRLLKKWILRPLISQHALEQRQSYIQALVNNPALCEQLGLLLAPCGDLERMCGKMNVQRAGHYDYRLMHALLCSATKASEFIQTLFSEIIPHQAIQEIQPLINYLERAYPINHFDTETAIADNFDAEIDALRSSIKQEIACMSEIERNEQLKTGITGLKIRHSGPHGYAFEVTKGQLKSVPDYFIRQQTLVGKERFVTPELKACELRLDHARLLLERREKIVTREIATHVMQFIPCIRRIAQALTISDAFYALAITALRHNYIKPTFNNNGLTSIKEGKHPIVATQLQGNFVPNNTFIDATKRMVIITGPNMGGKSTYMRQIALIQIMSQIGSFVPAREANMQIVDKICTRIGAGDAVALQKSTFWMEMEEVATICSLSTDKTLVILDEVGRGTSTHEGAAIAHALIEHLIELRPICFFSTHFHEVAAAFTTNKHSSLLHVTATKKQNGELVLLHLLKHGIADLSFGIDVAQKAGIPSSVVQRARMLLKEENKRSSLSTSHTETYQDPNKQLHAFASEIAKIQPDELSPRQAHEVLEKIIHKAAQLTD